MGILYPATVILAPGHIAAVIRAVQGDMHKEFHWAAAKLCLAGNAATRKEQAR